MQDRVVIDLTSWKEGSHEDHHGHDPNEERNGGVPPHASYLLTHSFCSRTVMQFKIGLCFRGPL